MSKKNKDIQVQIVEETRTVNKEQVVVSQLVIGKKMIGEIIPEGKNFQVYAEGEFLSNVRSLDDGIETLIRNWNLHE